MLNIEYPKLEKKSFNGLELTINEPKTKINLRGKKKDFFTKAGKILSLILPTEANTSSSNEKFNALWLSPDEWIIYFNDDDKNGIFLELYNEISKLNYGAITDVSNQWVCFNLNGKDTKFLFEKLLTIDLFSFVKKQVIRTSINKINCFVLCHNQFENYTIICPTSFSESMKSRLLDLIKLME